MPKQITHEMLLNNRDHDGSKFSSLSEAELLSLFSSDRITPEEYKKLKGHWGDKKVEHLREHWNDQINLENISKKKWFSHKDAVAFLLMNNCDDLVLNDRPETKPEERIYVSDVLKAYANQLENNIGNSNKDYKVLICNDCKKFWIAPKYKCDCGCSTLTETHPSNIEHAK